MIIKVVSVRDGQPIFDAPIADLLKECVPGGALQVLTPLEFISYQQIKWWKGILLPALSKDSGDSVEWWETRIKLAVMPDEFAPTEMAIKGRMYQIVPSITKLSKKKMGELIEGSVTYCRDVLGLQWITLPDTDLRTT